MIHPSSMIEVFQVDERDWVAKTHITFFSSKGKQNEVFGDVSTYCSFNTITKAIDTLFETLNESGVILRDRFTLAYTYIGIKDQDYPPINENWKEIIIGEAKSRGWEAFVELIK